MAKVNMTPHWPGDPWRESDAQAPMTVTVVPPATVSAPQSAPTQTLESQAFEDLTAIAHACNAHHDKVDRDAIDPLTGQIDSAKPAFKLAHAEFADSEHARRIDTIERQIAERVAAKKRAREQIRKSLVKEGDTAAEIRASRKWEADRNLLEAQGGSLETGRKLLEDADPAELSVLLEQLPKYYAAQGIDASGVINAVLPQKCPALAEADADLRLAERRAAVVTTDAAGLRADIASGCKVRPESLVDPKVVR